MWSFNNTQRPDRCAPVQCPACSAWVDPYHPRDARTGVHTVASVTKVGDTVESFVVTRCERADQRRRDEPDETDTVDA